MHGGGFVAGEPQSHEIYLNHFALKTNCPIFSVEYSLAPQTQFPFALEECLQVYRWLRSTTKHKPVNFNPSKIFLMGDSAGGNLAFGLVLRILYENDLKLQPPNAIFSFYPALNLTDSILSSPSRLLFAHDLFVPVQWMLQILKAYVPKQAEHCWLSSPIFAPDLYLRQLPPTRIYSAGYDPLLDDSTHMVRRMLGLGVNVTQTTFKLPHGFLSFSMDSIPETKTARDHACRDILEMLEL